MPNRKYDMNCKLYLEKFSKYTIHQYTNQQTNKKSMLTMTVIYKKTDENNESSTVKIKTL